MHDSIPAMERVLDHYAGGHAPNPLLSELIRPIALSAEECSDLIAFLNSLTDEEASHDPRWTNPWKIKDQINPERRASSNSVPHSAEPRRPEKIADGIWGNTAFI